ncbi:MAG: hypothetical protein Q7S75_03480 [bacterium]|nr:hypothetical protein [bacterium]
MALEVTGKLAEDKRNLKEVLTGREVANIVESVFNKIPPVLSHELVDSNIVLTLAGIKPVTSFHCSANSSTDTEMLHGGILTLNSLLSKNYPNIRFHLIGQPFNKPSGKKERIQMASVENLQGWERVSSTTKIPGIRAFDSRSGWDGLKRWHTGVVAHLERVNYERNIPTAEHVPPGRIVLEGLELGYPDQAIFDFLDYLEKSRKPSLQDSHIPYTGTYQEHQPNYDFYPEHANNPAIQRNIAECAAVLKDFYESDWHKKISPSLDFHRQAD